MNSPTKPKKKQSPQAEREQALAAVRPKKAPPDPLAALNPKSLGLRIGIPLLLAWIIAFALDGWIPKAVAGVLTLAVAGLILWVIRYAKRSRSVARIVHQADTAESRKEALEKLETDFKKDDTAAIFAKAQLELQDDPRKALRTLEVIKLQKVMAPVADEARAQRAMIHLLLGETDEARQLADAIDLTRHKDHKTRATMAAVVAEAFARTGKAKRAVEILETFDPDDAMFEDVRAQLLRARAFAYAWANDSRQMKQTLRKLQGITPQLLSGFVTKKKHPGGVSPRGVHPLLEKEALAMLTRSGAVPRKVEFRRG